MWPCTHSLPSSSRSRLIYQIRPPRGTTRRMQVWMLRKHLEPSPGPGSPIPACRWVPVSSEGAGWRPAPFQATLLLKASTSARVKRHFLAGPQGIMGRVCTWSLHLGHSHQGSTWPTSAGGRTCPPEEGPALWAGGHHANREKIRLPHHSLLPAIHQLWYLQPATGPL